jgi:stearoyl-CoA desaturase (delta-9 desaturase)
MTGAPVTAPGGAAWTEIPRPSRLRLQRLAFAAGTALPLAGAAAAVLFTAATGPSWVEPVTFGLMLVVSGVGVEVGYHRYFSHGSFQTTPTVRALLAIAGATAVQGPVSYWVAHHRLHHATSDGPGDPHSPHGRGSRLAGLLHAHVGWIFSPTRASPGRFARDILADRRLMWVSRHFPVWILLGILLPAAVGGLGERSRHGVVAGLLWGGFARIFAAQHLTYLVNSACHLVGRKPFPGRDQSRNLRWLVLPTFGGSLHNNHHAFPAAADLRFGTGELDPSGLFIRALAALGWAWDVKRPGPAQIDRRRQSPEEDKP